MFSNLPPFLRLSLCLFVSIGLHGGLLFSDWMTNPAGSRLPHAPVVVAFLPAVDPASPAASAQVHEESEKVSSSVVPGPAVAKLASAVSRPPASVRREALSKTLPGKFAPVAVDKSKEEVPLTMPAAEMVCMPPQVVSGPPPVQPASSRPDDEPAETGTMFTEVANQAASAQLQGGGKDSLESTAPLSHALIEAIPNYRSNPLPEYPYIARQKRWEGVVWLMVDVSADGLVDDLRVERSCGHQVLDQAARRTVSRWQFSPAKRAGLPVSSLVRIPVRFRLEDG